MLTPLLARIGPIVVACCFLDLGCSSETHEASGDTGSTAKEGEPMYSLGLDNPTVVQLIGVDVVEPGKQKFVQVELVEVVNPKRHPISFEVRYRRKDQEEIVLGTFSPFPPDNRGTFIVATRGVLESGGAVVVSLVLPAGVDKEDDIRVKLKPITFRMK